MSSFLSSLRLLITRPNPAGEELCAQLAQLGANTFHLPTIDIQPCTDTTAFAAALDRLGEQDWIVFISPQAVYTSVTAIRRRWPHFAPTVHFAAMGEGTALALCHAGYAVQVIPKKAHSEGFLSLPTFQSVNGKKIALVHGEGGRSLLAQSLSQRGATVTHLISYKRNLPALDDQWQMIDFAQMDAILCHSYESVANLKSLLSIDKFKHLQRTPLLVPSERIKRLAGDLGFQTIWVTNNASHQAFITLLEQKRKEKWPMKQ